MNNIKYKLLSLRYRFSSFLKEDGSKQIVAGVA